MDFRWLKKVNEDGGKDVLAHGVHARLGPRPMWPTLHKGNVVAVRVLLYAPLETCAQGGLGHRRTTTPHTSRRNSAHNHGARTYFARKSKRLAIHGRVTLRPGVANNVALPT